MVEVGVQSRELRIPGVEPKLGEMREILEDLFSAKANH